MGEPGAYEGGKADSTDGTYSATVLDHIREPRNAGSMANADGHAMITGPCGDTMSVWLRVRDGLITDASFWTDGCGTTIAAGSMVTELARGRKGRQMKCQITALSENTAFARPRGLLGEWGLSALVETDDIRVLLDAGASISAVRNGDLLGVDWSQIGAIVLSHGHYDHTGGLREVMKRIGKPTKIIAHPDVWDKKYSQPSQDQPPTDIGIPFQKADLESLGATFQITREPVWLSDHLVTSGEIPMTTDYEAIDPGMYVEKNDALLPDPLADDQALFIKTDQGLAVVLGCAHRGVINTLRHARKVTGVQSLHTVIGGTHLIRASEVQMELTIAELREMGVQRLGVAHCTGMAAAVRLAQEFGQRVVFVNTGTTVTV